MKNIINAQETENEAFNREELLIEPTTEARLKFVEEFVPQWMEQFDGDDWETAHRLAEEIEENFQFVDESVPVEVHEGLLRQVVSLSHIIVMQQLEIARLKNSNRTDSFS